MALLPTFRLAMRMLPLALWLAVASGCADSAQRAAENAAIAESQLAAGDVEAARKSIREVIAERDDVADCYILLGRIELRAQQLTSAFNAYSMALDLQADISELADRVTQQAQMIEAISGAAGHRTPAARQRPRHRHRPTSSRRSPSGTPGAPPPRPGVVRRGSARRGL